MISNFKTLIALTFTALISLSTTVSAENTSYDSLAQQMQQFAADHEIEINGLDIIASLPPTQPRQGSVERQIKAMLKKCNYVSIKKPGAGIEKIIILDRSDWVADQTILQTQKRGKNHIVQAVVAGFNAHRIEVAMVVDTGADYVVLPHAMMSSLGLEESDTQRIKLQTANGIIDAKLGILAGLEIGNEFISNVETAFIADRQLNGIKLLGMNVLNQYRFTLDDQQQTLTLIKND